MSFVVDIFKMLTCRDSRCRLAVLAVSLTVFWGFMVWSFGYMPALGSGFANADTVKYMRVSLVEDAIIERRIRYCEAPSGSAVKRFFLKVVNQKVTEYLELTGTSYNLPTCEELVVVST